MFVQACWSDFSLFTRQSHGYKQQLILGLLIITLIDKSHIDRINFIVCHIVHYSKSRNCRLDLG